ncbi:hypothetical protein ES707_06855 [subsurface metagenome]
MTATRADFAQQLGHTLDKPALGAQHFLVDLGDLPFADRNRNDRLGIGVGGIAQVLILNRHRADALRCHLGSRRVMREQRRRDAALELEEFGGDAGIGAAGDRGIELVAQRRQVCEQVGAARDQRGDPLDAGAIGRKAFGDAVDHVLLLGREFEAGLFQDVAQRRRGFRDLGRLRAGIGDEVARGQPQLVHAAVDILGKVADALQPLQLTKGLVDVPDGDDAGRAGDHDDREHQHEAAERHLADRERSHPIIWWIRRRFGSHMVETYLQSAVIYDVFRGWGNMLKFVVNPTAARNAPARLPAQGTLPPGPPRGPARPGNPGFSRR